MKITHLNCGTFCPFGGALLDGSSRGPTAHLICRCLLIESNDGLILIDTGLGTEDIRFPETRLSPVMRHLVRPKLRMEETALHQIQELGFKAKDVRHIILTHLDFDHAGGVSDFPEAKVHVLEEELRTATHPKGFIAKSRYRQEQMRSHANWNTYNPQGENWFGFSSVRNLKGLPPEFLFIPLKGHTLGHAGVAIQTNEGWHLHAGDAYFHHHQLAPKYSCPPALTAYQRIMDMDRDTRIENLNRLRDLQRLHSAEVSVVCSHDASHFP